MFVPKRQQFRRWSVPSKWSYISGILGLLGLMFAIYFGFWPKSDHALGMAEMEDFAEVIITQVLDGSSLCCEMRTGEVIIHMSEDKRVLILARQLVIFDEERMRQEQLSFSFSVSRKDSIMELSCAKIGVILQDVYFFKHGKVFCSKQAVINLRDSMGLCE